MPSCIHCNRPFVNKEALHQHIASSSIPHPECIICDRRFISDAAREAHMASKHPPTFDCTICSRSFGTPGALDDHYRGSTAHPNCSRCGKGFKDFIDHQEHRRTAHVPIPCDACGGIMIDQSAQEAHFKSSPNHPACVPCERAFKDKDAYITHINLIHAGQVPMSRDGGNPASMGAPEIILRAPALAPARPPVQNLPLARQPDTWRTSFKPLPPPGEAMNRIWGTHENVQVSSSFAPPQIPRRAEAEVAGIRRDRFRLQDYFRQN